MIEDIKGDGGDVAEEPMDVDDEDEEPESEEEVRYSGDTPLGPLPSFLVTYR